MDELDEPMRMHGEDWEERILTALRLRYQGGQLTELRAVVGGDGGLEAYSHDGLGYQCHVARTAVTKRDCLESQKKKVTGDTGKLKANADILERRLGGLKLTRWVLVVPEWYSSALVDHCNRRADIVKGWGLPFIDPDDFRIIVHDEGEYRPELAALGQSGVVTLDLVVDGAVESDLEDVAARDADLVRKLEGKLSDFVPDLDATRRYYLRAFVNKGKVMDQLREFPSTRERVDQLRRAREQLVEQEGLLSGHTGASIAGLASDFAEQLIGDMPMLGVESASALATGNVADWLMRCPLKPTSRNV